MIISGEEGQGLDLRMLIKETQAIKLLNFVCFYKENVCKWYKD